MSALPLREDLAGAPTNAEVQQILLDMYDMVAQRLAAGTTGAGTATSEELQLARQTLNVAPGPHGRCRLSYQSSTALILTPYNGNTIVINGQVVTIPSAGVTLSNSGVASGTRYYIYLYLNSGVPTLERSTTGHSTDAATGVEIKTGDATRTLVGMARTTDGGTWGETSSYKCVLSYFNRREIVAQLYFGTNYSVLLTSYTAVNGGGQTCQWLTWADEPVKFSVNGFFQNSSAGQLTYTSIGVDGTTAQDVFNLAVGTNGGPLGLSLANTFSEGYHYSTILGKVSGGTGSWSGGGAAGERTTHQAIVMG